MRILIIDNALDRDDWGAEPLRRYARQVVGATVHVRRGPHDDLPTDPSRFDRIVVSGSRTSCLEDAPWIDNLHTLIRRAVDQGKPFLGVCYGHQSLIRALSSKERCRRLEEVEYGWTTIEKTRDSKLLAGLPDKFVTFSSHQEEISELPKGFKLLAKSSLCAIQGAELEGKPVFGIQFHPEKNLGEGTKTVQERKRNKLPIINADAGPRLYDAQVGETIFGNFFKL